ncbi:hypothetical protein LMG8323_04217 [Ralstonia mannitolilytica]|nr:hypothetical protein LMG8323_04217 [Ralstonia mannitolilytica]
MVSTYDDWTTRLWELAARHAEFGLIADLHALTLIELWGIYCLVVRADGGVL